MYSSLSGKLFGISEYSSLYSFSIFNIKTPQKVSFVNLRSVLLTDSFIIPAALLSISLNEFKVAATLIDAFKDRSDWSAKLRPQFVARNSIRL